MRDKLIIVAATLFCVATGVRWLELRRRPQARVARGAVEERILARALVEPTGGVAKVRARTDGRVTRVLVRVGDRVHAGDLLAEIKEDALVTELSRREAERQAAELSARAIGEGARPEARAVTAAEVEAARREVALAEDRAARQAQLRSSGSTSQAEATDAQRSLEIARARLSRDEAELALARAGGRPVELRAAQAHTQAAAAAVEEARSELERTRVVAPVDGVILERRIDPGDTISGTQTGGPPLPLFEIADPDRLELRIEVEERDATGLAIGQTVLVTAEGGGATIARSQLTRLAPQMSGRTISLGGARLRADGRVRCVWAPLDGAPFVIGEQLEAIVLLARHEVDARVPRTALQIRDGRRVVDAIWGPFVHEVPVQTGVVDDLGAQIRGVALGQRVLLH